MNGTDVLSVWHTAFLKTPRLRGALYDTFIKCCHWIKEHQFLYNGDPKCISQVALYYSLNTHYINDFFPKAWFHGGGPFGQYFKFTRTYYNLSYNHIPVDCIMVPLEKPEMLSSFINLNKYKVLILVDAQNMSEK